MSDTNQQLAKFIRDAMGREPIRAVAERAGISHAALGKLITGKAKAKPETLRALAPALGVSETTLLRMAGYLGVNPRSLTDAHVIDVAHQLEDMPPQVRGRALTAVDAVVTQFWELVNDSPTEGEKDAVGDEIKNTRPEPGVSVVIDEETYSQIVELCMIVLAPETEKEQPVGDKKEDTAAQKYAEAILDMLRRSGQEVSETIKKSSQQPQKLEVQSSS